MKYLKSYESSEWIGNDNEDVLNQSKVWSEIEDILTTIDDFELIYVIDNFKHVTSSKSSISIRKDWSQIPNSQDGKRYFNITDVKDELNHLCSRFPEIINQVQLFRTRGGNPVRYKPEEFIECDTSGFVFLVAITLKIQKEGARFIPR